MREPLEAVEENGLETSVAQNGELTSLVRRWMAAGTTVQDRVRRESILRVAPEPRRVESERVEPERVEPERVEAAHAAPMEPESRHAVAMDSMGIERVDVDRMLAFPPLPQRTTRPDTAQGNRVALLIDARRMSADVATGILARLGERGSVNVCRAYADWGSADLGDWGGRMPREGLRSFHHFSDEDEQALVAMAIDAVDLARDAAIDEVVIAGDLTSALPLVHRLHAAGVRVVAVGPGHTPYDVRAACHEFIDTESIDVEPIDVEPIDRVRNVTEGRHRA